MEGPTKNHDRLPTPARIDLLASSQRCQCRIRKHPLSRRESVPYPSSDNASPGLVVKSSRSTLERLISHLLPKLGQFLDWRGASPVCGHAAECAQPERYLDVGGHVGNVHRPCASRARATTARKRGRADMT